MSTVFDDLRNVDICPLATAEEVIAGHVPVIFPVVLSPQGILLDCMKE